MFEPSPDSFAVRTWVDSPEGQNRLLVLKVICAALPFGVLLFLAATLFVSPFREKDGQPDWLLVGVGTVVFALSAGASFFIGGFLPKQGSTDPVSLANNAQTQWIISYALLEGPAFLCLVLSLAVASNLEKGILMGMAIGLLLLMILRFPTRTRFLAAMGASD